MVEELEQLRSAGMKPSAGDIRCIAYGHITRMAIANLRKGWNVDKPTTEKLSTIKAAMDAVATIDAVKAGIEELGVTPPAVKRTTEKQKMMEPHDAATL